MRAPKVNVSASRGKSKTGKASRTSMKALVSKCIVSQRRSIFRSLKIGVKRRRMMQGMSRRSPGSNWKPTIPRNASVAGVKRSMTLKPLQKKTRGAGLTRKRSKRSIEKITSKELSTTAPTTFVNMKGGSCSTCSIGVATETKSNTCVATLYQHAALLESEFSKKRYIFVMGFVNNLPLEESPLTKAALRPEACGPVIDPLRIPLLLATSQTSLARSEPGQLSRFPALEPTSDSAKLKCFPLPSSSGAKLGQGDVE
mmetsp:Transcript_32387/g.75202  ORF Transcript_32387/g.75202 Transcript_32387/m.75202 type:complete len:256 (-) Transcript_32387:534-1301(-)